MARPLNAYILFAVLMALFQLVTQSSARPQPGEIEDMKRALMAACKTKYPVTEEMMNNIKKGILSEERNFKCIAMCFLDELSLIDGEGVIDGESMIAMAQESMKTIIEQSVKSCLPDIAGKPDSCEVAYNFLTCSLKLNPKMIDLVPV